MHLEWILDGPQTSLLVDLESTLRDPQQPIGTVNLNSDGTWTGYDCTRANQHGTTAMPVGVRTTREEAKELVEECFRTGSPDAPEGQVKADFTSNPWTLAVERRWSEVCELLEAHISKERVQPADTVKCLVHELTSLYTVSQYAGSNARSGWITAIVGYRLALGL